MATTRLDSKCIRKNTEGRQKTTCTFCNRRSFGRVSQLEDANAQLTNEVEHLRRQAEGRTDQFTATDEFSGKPAKVSK